jgi:transketolase
MSKSSSNSVKKCEKNFCTKYTKKLIDLTLTIKDKILNSSDISPEKKKQIEQNFKKTLNKLKKTSPEDCSVAFCNPTCEGTIFQNGNELPEKIKKKFSKKKYGQKIIEMLIKLRESLFKGEKTIIKNGFYKELKAKNVKKIKKNGGLSGCSIMVI